MARSSAADRKKTPLAAKNPKKTGKAAKPDKKEKGRSSAADKAPKKKGETKKKLNKKKKDRHSPWIILVEFAAARNYTVAHVSRPQSTHVALPTVACCDCGIHWQMIKLINRYR